MQDPDANPAQPQHSLQRLLNHRLLLVLIVFIGLLAAAGWGYWFYESLLQRPQRIAELEEKAARQRNGLMSLNRSLDALSGSSQPPPRFESLGNSLLAPLDGIRSVDQIALLADRIGVELSNLQITPGTARPIGELELSVFDLSFKAAGSLDALADFSRALDEGIIPWLSMEEIQVNTVEQRATLSAKGSLFTLSSRPPGASPPIFLKGGSPSFQSLVSAESYGVVSDVPVLSFSVESLFDGMDSLRSIQIQVSNPELMPTFHLYAETDNNNVTFPLGPFFGSILEFNNSEPSRECRPSSGAACPSLFSTAEDRLIPTVSTATSEGEFRLDLSTPFPFYGHKEQRFYLTADIQSLPDSETVVSIEIPVDGISFASGKWPPHDQFDPFATALLLRPGPAGVTDPLAAYSGGEASASGKEIGFSFTQQDQGTYEVRLEVSDEAGGIRKDTRIITVTKANPTVQFNVGPLDRHSTVLTRTRLDPGANATFKYKWVAGKDGGSPICGIEKAFSFIPNGQGAYQSRLEVSDDAGGKGQESIWVKVTQGSPGMVFIDGSELGLGRRQP